MGLIPVINFLLTGAILNFLICFETYTYEVMFHDATKGGYVPPPPEVLKYDRLLQLVDTSCILTLKIDKIGLL